jgi:3D (Asp-Asp-Asp) domain-containing protein
MLISRSATRKLLATLGIVTAFVLLYQVTALDSRFALRQLAGGGIEPPPQPGTTLQFSATAYCKGTTTASGVNVRSGIAAADPDLLPVGSVIQVDAPGARNDGVYTIMDTGPKVQGRHLDLYMWSCHEALKFGRPGIKVVLLRLGWNPQASTPTIMDRLFRRREAAAKQDPTPLPAEAERQIPPATLPDPAEVVPPPAAPADQPASPATTPVPPLPDPGTTRVGPPTPPATPPHDPAPHDPAPAPQPSPTPPD